MPPKVKKINNKDALDEEIMAGGKLLTSAEYMQKQVDAAWDMRVNGGYNNERIAAAFNVSPSTVARWFRRYKDIESSNTIPIDKLAAGPPKPLKVKKGAAPTQDEMLERVRQYEDEKLAKKLANKSKPVRPVVHHVGAAANNGDDSDDEEIVAVSPKLGPIYVDRAARTKKATGGRTHPRAMAARDVPTVSEVLERELRELLDDD